MNVLFLGTDAFGGRGGIANYNRCLIRALDLSPHVTGIKVLLRTITDPTGPLPGKVELVREATGGKVHFALETMRAAGRRPDLIFCGHVNLGPLASWASRRARAPFVAQVHGVDVWERPASGARAAALCRAAEVLSVSQFTVDRMREWCQLDPARFRVLPNMIDLAAHSPAPRRSELVEHYGLDGKRVLMTLARLDSRERYKGIDEVLEVLPTMLQTEPRLTYLVAGSGDDQERLRDKARALGLESVVRFLGYLPDGEKLDTLRLADAFVMPGSGEGFGIVYLEALACGVNVVGSCLDASEEALLGGELGAVVDPRDPECLQQGIFAALDAPPPNRALLETYGWDAFAARVAAAAADWSATLSRH